MTAETRETKGQAALREQLKRNLSDAIVEMEVEEAERIAKEITAQGLFQMNLLETSVAAGMAVASRLYEEGEYFIPELLSCADAAEAATEIFRPYMLGEKPAPKGCVVIGSVEGDTHDIGKNIVALVIEAGGYEVHDLGRDVPASVFADAVEAHHPDAVALASLMTTSIGYMADVVQELTRRGTRSSCKIIIGGKPVSTSFAKKIGADYYAPGAGEAVRLLDDICSRRS